MPNENDFEPDTNNSPSFIDRVLASDAARKGVAAAAAGILIAVVTEAIWPSE